MSQEETPKKKKKPGIDVVWREARDLLWERRGRLGLGLAVVGINRLAGLVLPASSKFLIDDVIGQRKVELLLPLAIAAGVATLVQAVTSFGLTQILGIAAQRTITDIRKAVHEHVLRLPVSFFDSHKSGELISRIMTDAEGVRNLVGTGVVQLAGGLLTAGIAFVVLLYLNWRLTLITLVVALLFAGVMAFAFTRLRPIFRQRGELNARVSGRLAEAVGGVRVVKAYTAEKREERIFAGGVHELFRNVATTMTAIAGVSAATSLIFGIVGVVMMLIGGRAILAGTMTLGDFVSYIFFTGLLVMPMVQISSISTQITEAFAGLDRIRELRRLPTERDADVGRKRLHALRGDVAFEDVWFEYESSQPVLRGVSFTAPAGSTTALVGSSGSGKSTLIGLVMAFHRPSRGRVLVDGLDLDQVRLHDYRRHLGIVLQDNFLFDGTIADNVAYSKPQASRAEVEEAGRLAHCDVFVDNFPEGWDTVVGERGVKLSGGQRQRVGIARAILADPTLLILDEATSSLDSESEGLIQDGLQRLRRGRTTFVIAHRLSTIQAADQILVIEGGEIVERGNHAELLARGGRYRELYDKQVRLTGDLYTNPGEDFTPEPEATTAKLPTGRATAL